VGDETDESTPRILGAGGTFKLEPPRLRTTADPNEERHATWFELFFDLVFVAAVAQLGLALARHPSPACFVRFAALFPVVLWAWITFALYANRFGTDDLIFRLAKSGAMLAIAAVGIDVHRLLYGHGGGPWFASAYTVLRLLLIGLYVRAYHHVTGPGRRLSLIYVRGYSVTTSLWLVSIAVPGPARYCLWAAAMCGDFAIAIRAWTVLDGAVIVVSHLTERFGTFFIIVLGESVVAVVSGLSGAKLSVDACLVGTGCLVMALCLWWIYFDLADTSVVGRGALGLVYVYSHAPLLAAVVVTGEGMKLAVGRGAVHALTASARWALAGGIATFSLSLAALHLGAEWTSMHDRSLRGRLALSSFAIALAIVGARFDPIVFTVILGAAVVAQLMLEAFTPRQGAASVVPSPLRLVEALQEQPPTDESTTFDPVPEASAG
jgi:low temperature requirement protein LtrA